MGDIIDLTAARARRASGPHERPRLLLDALDALGVALADHEHVWSADERLLYESATDDLKQHSRFADMADAEGSYEGALEDCNSAVEALIRRIKGEADLGSAQEWVCLNYPALAFKHDLMDDAQRARFVAKKATGED